MPADDGAPVTQGVAERVLQAPNAWRVLTLLFAANLFNFYDRAIPSIVTQPIKAEFGLSDLAIGILFGAFTVVYALAGIPLGRLADLGSRSKIMGWGLAAWSVMTAATGLAWNYTSLLLIRIGVGVGEAAYAPAANSMIADLFPAQKRARAVGTFQLGLPIGLILAFFTVGSITQAFGSWRAAFFIAAVPGLILAVCLFFVREPRRGASEVVAPTNRPEPVDRPFRRIFAVRTMWWLIVAGIGANLASYSVNAFTVPLLQRYFGLGLTNAAVLTGVVVGITGLIGLVAGGVIADRADRRSPAARVLVGAIGALVAAPLTFLALRVGPDGVGLFVVLFGAGWLLQYLYFTSAYPAVADVVPPRLRSTAMAIFFAAFYLLGGALGPVIAGALSDTYAQAAVDSGAPPAAAAAVGLQQSLLVIVPVSLLVAAVGLFLAARTVGPDGARMQAGLTDAD
jgi:MFS family permease